MRVSEQLVKNVERAMGVAYATTAAAIGGGAGEGGGVSPRGGAT